MGSGSVPFRTRDAACFEIEGEKRDQKLHVSAIVRGGDVDG